MRYAAAGNTPLHSFLTLSIRDIVTGPRNPLHVKSWPNPEFSKILPIELHIAKTTYPYPEQVQRNFCIFTPGKLQYYGATVLTIKIFNFGQNKSN